MLIAAIRKLIGFLSPYPMVLPGVAFLGVIASLAEGIGIGLLIPFFSNVTQSNASQAGVAPAVGVAANGVAANGGTAIGDGGGLVTQAMQAYAGLWPQNYQLIMVAISIAALVAFSCVVNYLYLRLLSWAATRVTHDLRTRLFDRFLNSDQVIS